MAGSSEDSAMPQATAVDPGTGREKPESRLRGDEPVIRCVLEAGGTRLLSGRSTPASLAVLYNESKETILSQGLHLQVCNYGLCGFKTAILILKTFLAVELYPCLLLLLCGNKQHV
jgi:hypothetical protein